MKEATLCVLCKGDNILLGMKKVRFGAGKYNGYGGKVNPNETIETAAIRELKEELDVTAKDLEKVGQIDFYFPPENENWNQTVHIYLVRQWEGDPKESEEMRPDWFHRNAIPYDKMWIADRHWFPHVLEGKYVEGKVNFGPKGDSIISVDLQHRQI